MPSDRDSAWLTAQAGSSGTAARKTSTTPTTIHGVGVTASVGDARLTIRSSKSPLSESPRGPSASMGIDGRRVRPKRTRRPRRRRATCRASREGYPRKKSKSNEAAGTLSNWSRGSVEYGHGARQPSGAPSRGPRSVETLLSDLSAGLIHVDASGLDAALERGLRQLVA